MLKIFNRKLLVIYDSVAIAETISLFGKDRIPCLTELSTPENTLDEISKNIPDICLLCAMTEKTKAFDVCRSIKTHDSYKDLPVIILALNDGEKNRQKASASGADLCLNLALPVDEIIEHLNMLSDINSSRTHNINIEDISKRLEKAELNIAELQHQLKKIISEM